MIQSGDLVTLVGSKGKFVVKVTEDMQKVSGLGVVDPKRLIEKNFGDEVQIVDQKFIILEPSLFDKIENIKRKAQIILPKDALQLIGMCNISSGSVVIEGGIGSGALTIALAHFVAPGGRIISYDNRRDFAKVAQKNLNFTGLEKNVELKLFDITNGFEELNADAVILDIPNPEEVVLHAKNALKPGGYFAAYVPTMNQVERLIIKLKDHHFFEPRTIETLQRDIVVGEGAVRPSFNMLGHTGYVTVARKII